MHGRPACVGPIGGTSVSRRSGNADVAASAAIAFGAPSRATAWRRVLLLAALLSFATAWVVWTAFVSGIPEAVQSSRSENAQGLSLLVLLGGLALLGIVPAFFALGLVLGAIAYFAGRAACTRHQRRGS